MKHISFFRWPLLVFVCVVLFHTVAAQNGQNQSKFALIYQITNEQAKQLMLNDGLFDPALLQNKLYERPLETRLALPTGHYVLFSAKGEYLQMEALSVVPFKLITLCTKPFWSFILKDNLGNPITNAEILFEQNKVPFDTTTLCYTLEEGKKGGLMEVTALGMTDYYLVESTQQQENDKLSARFQSKALFRKKNKKEHAHAGHFYPDAKFRYPEPNVQSFGGYMAFSQPTYKPGDSLQIKAWLTDETKRPWNQPVEFNFVEDGRKKWGLMLEPEKPGVFTFGMKLGDSLTLDKNYQIVLRGYESKRVELFSNKKELRTYIYQQGFRYEDYLLDELKYQFTQPQREYQLGDTLHYRLATFTASGLPISDGQYKAVATMTRIDNLYEGDCYIPDTLWREEGNINASGYTDFMIPSAFLPKGNYVITTSVYCNNHSGEQKTLTQMTYLRKILPKAHPKVNVYGERIRDSITLTIQNPSQIPIQYWIFSGEDLVSKGVVLDRRWEWNQSNMYKDIRFRYVYLLGGKVQEHEQEFPFKANELTVGLEAPPKVLPGDVATVKIAVTDANKRPVKGADLTAGGYNDRFGDRAPFDFVNPQINKDYAPIKTAYTIQNVRHKIKELPLSSDWYAMLELNKIPFYQLLSSKTVILKDTFPVACLTVPVDALLTSAQLKEARGIYPDTPGYTQFSMRQPYLDRAQVAPFVIEGQHSESIHLIWINNNLVYYRGTGTAQPYSFLTRPGRVTIRLRTSKREYVLANVLLTAGKKHLISISSDHWDGREISVKTKGVEDFTVFYYATISWVARTEQPLPIEQKTLQASMLQLHEHNDRTMEWVEGEHGEIHKVNHNYPQMVGPFKPYNPLNVCFSDGSCEKNFLFEPRYKYQWLRGKERLYASDWPKDEPIKFLPGASPMRIGERAFGIFDVLPLTQTVEQYTYINPPKNAPGLGKLYLIYPDSMPIIGIAFKKAQKIEGLYAAQNGLLYELVPGRYTLLVFAKSGQVVEQALRICPDTTLCVRLDKAAFRAPLLGNAIQDFSFCEEVTVVRANEYSILPKQPTREFFTGGPNFLTGKVIDVDTQEELIGASVKVFARNSPVRKTMTDVNGDFRMALDAGTYDIEVGYTGYRPQIMYEVQVLSGELNHLDIHMETSTNTMLSPVEVRAYRVPNMLEDQTSGGQTISSEKGLKLPPKDKIPQKQTLEADLRQISMQQLDNGHPSGSKPSDGADMPPVHAMRSEFKDLAYFLPLLSTDRRGEAQFQVQLPEDMTTWSQYAIAADAKGRLGIGRARTRAFKQLNAQLALPRFAVAGDRFEVSGRIINATADSLSVKSRFAMDGVVLSNNNHKISHGVAEFQEIIVPQTDSVSVSYEVYDDFNTDGERRRIPVLSIGVEEPIQHFTFANKDTVFNWAFHPNGSEITIDAHYQTLQFLLKDVKYLLRYPYGCNEQTASRLLALLWYKKIKNMTNEQVNVEEDIRFCIQRLENSQNAAGSWGWWRNDQFQPWMSQYVTSALLKAREAGFTVKRLDLALSFLSNRLPAMSWDEQMVVLNLLHKAGAKVDYTPYLEKASIRANFANAQPKDKLDFLQLKQWSKKRIYPSDLYPLLKSDQISGYYVACGITAWYNRSYTNTLLAYDIAHQAGWVGITDSITNYWLHQITGIQNTFEKAQILERVLPKYSEYLERKEEEVHLEINGKTYSEFPIQVKVPAASQIRIFKTGNTPLYLTAYQTHYNPDPTPRSDQYAVSTRLLLSNGTPSGTLTYGESATLEVTVEAAATSDYVMIEVPIPAGCTYGPKAQPAYRSSPEVHREYFKDRTAIFCTRLPKGTHVFRIPLESRFTGKFTLNPTKVEQMYFPLFYGRNGVQVVEVR